MRPFAILLVASVLAISVSSMAIEQEQTDLEEIKPRLFGIVTDFYNMIIAEPVNHLASSLAAMSAQLVAGIALNGIGPIFGKREIIDKYSQQLHAIILNLINTLKEKYGGVLAQIMAQHQLPRGLLDDFWTMISNGAYDIANSAIQSAAMSITQLLANFSVGKRAALEKGALDDLVNTLQNGAYDIANSAISSIAMSITQLLANFANGKRDLLNQLFPEVADFAHFLHNLFILGGVIPAGKRSLEKGLLDELLNTLQSGAYDLANTVVSSTAMTLTQLLAQIANGKRDVLAQLFPELADFANFLHNYLVLGGVIAPGKRALEKGMFDDLLNSLQSQIYDLANTAVSSLAMSITQMLANFSQGKRDLLEKGMFDDLLNNLQNQIYDLANTAVSSLAMSITQLLANFSQGKRDLEKGMFDDLVNNLQNSIYDLANTAVSSLAMSITQLLANFSQGKRSLEKGMFDDLLNSLQSQIYDLANTAVSSLAMSITQMLANFSQGKRSLEKGMFDDLLNSLQNQIYDLANTAVSSLAMSITQMLANFSQGKREVSNVINDIAAFLEKLGYNVSVFFVFAWWVVSTVGKNIVELIGYGIMAIIHKLFPGLEMTNQRGVSSILSNIGNTVFNTVDSAVQSAAYQLAALLVHISNNGILPTIGKRSNNSVDSFVHQLLTIISQMNGHLSSGSASNLIGK